MSGMNVSQVLPKFSLTAIVSEMNTIQGGVERC